MQRSVDHGLLKEEPEANLHLERRSRDVPRQVLTVFSPSLSEVWIRRLSAQPAGQVARAGAVVGDSREPLGERHVVKEGLSVLLGL